MTTAIIYPILLFVSTFLFSCAGKERYNNHETYPSDEYEIRKPEQKQTLAPSIHVIEIKQMKFVPAELTVQKGEEVMWVNRDIVEHDVTERAHHAWTSSPLAMGQSWSMIATQTTEYYCNLHQVMKGKLVVIE